MLSQNMRMLHWPSRSCTGHAPFKRADLFNDTPDARHSANAGPLKLGHLQLAVEHAANESCVLVHLEGRALQLQLLHDTHGRIQIQHHASRADSPGLHYMTETSHILMHRHKCDSIAVAAAKGQDVVSGSKAQIMFSRYCIGQGLEQQGGEQRCGMHRHTTCSPVLPISPLQT